MSLIFDSFVSDLLAIVVVIAGAVYWYFNKQFQYWDKKGLPNVPPSFPGGNIGPFMLQKESFGNVIKDLYNKLKDKGPYSGFYLVGSPALLVNDPEQIKNIFVRDFNNFPDRGMYYNEVDDPISAHLFSLEGLKWKNLRAKLSPTFTSGKLKNMFPLMVESADKLNEYLLEEYSKSDIVESKELLARFTTDIIGTCAFGIECNALRNPDSEFRVVGNLVFTPTLWENIKGSLSITYKDLARKLRVTATNERISSFFMSLVTNTVNYREKNNVKRNDFMDLLIQLKNKGRLDDDGTNEPSAVPLKAEMSALTLNEIAAQAFIFFAAGFETSSTVMSFCLYELSLNEEIQEKVRKEVTAQFAKNNGKMTYEGLLQMEYLDKVINETLRKYPTLSILNRECANDYKIPGTDIVVPKGTAVFIPVGGIHHDPKYYPNPEKFDPERFSEENKSKRHHFTFLPFGEGPRICIGLRFGMMQTRLGLATLLLNYRWRVTDSTPIPLQMNPKSFVTNCLGGIKLKYEPVNK